MTQLISPQEAQRLVEENGAVLIDVREPDEFGNVRIPGSHLQPLSVLELLPSDRDLDKPAVYFCRTGRRTAKAMDSLERRGHAATYIVDGGLTAWQAAGLPVAQVDGPPPIMRQVHMAAGGLVLLFSLLALIRPGFSLLAALVGGGLVYSGLSGKCGMAMLLTHMPWNRKR